MGLNKSNLIWVIMQGKIGHSADRFAIYDRKADAIRDIRARGYKYSKKDKAFINYNDPIFGDARWYTIENRNVYEAKENRTCKTAY